MANLSTANIDELKNLGLITSTDSAEALASQSVDDLKNKNYVTQVIPSADIEGALTPASSSSSGSVEPEPEP